MMMSQAKISQRWT